MNDIHIKPELLRVLKALADKDFTVAEVTQAYLKSPLSPHESKKSARQFVYRNMLRLIKAGLMEKLPNNDGWPRYRLFAKFTDVADLPNVEPGKPVELPGTASETVSNQNELPVEALKERLGKHKSDMLYAMGEAEEYSALCEELPELRTKAQELYNQARERSAMLLGKIKALESLLSQSVGHH
jgi:hypothetical protein